jgi:hypothetical protein
MTVVECTLSSSGLIWELLTPQWQYEEVWPLGDD